MATETRAAGRRRLELAPIRGGLSAGAVFTGVVVAFGAFFLLSALIGGVLVATDVEQTATTVEVGFGVGIAVVVAQFLSYLWGGYAAGRMSRGAGLANGLLVPLIAIVIAIIIAAIATAMGANANLNLPFSASRLPLEEDFVVDWGTGLWIALLVAMFVGGALGGLLGARWHTRLERSVIKDREAEQAPPAVPEEGWDRSRTAPEGPSPGERAEQTGHPSGAAPTAPPSPPRTVRKPGAREPVVEQGSPSQRERPPSG